jgi:hypothetical protein
MKQFASEVPTTDGFATAPNIQDVLGAKAVPLAVLIDSSSTIRMLWPYSGTETTERLGDFCTGKAAPIMPPE